MSDMGLALVITGMALGALILISSVFVGLSALLAWLGRMGERRAGTAESTAVASTAPQRERAPAVEPPKAAAGTEKIVACPMPGTIVSVNVGVGDGVKAGDVLLVLESMKIQNEVRAPVDGEVKAVFVTEGASVKRADRLVSIVVGERRATPAPTPSARAPSRRSARSAPAAAPPTPSGAAAKVISCAMPGTVVSIDVKVGDQVRAGDVVLVLESMKIQNEIRAPRDGTVKELHVSEGANVRRGEHLVTLA